MTVPNAVEVIATLVSEGIGRVGAGTVRTTAQIEACVDAGAQFLVSPHLDPDLMLAGVARGVPVVPGALTASEILRAMALGASAVKLFAVSLVGGPEYVRAVLEPIPDARFVVSGEATSTRSASTRDGFSPRPQIRSRAPARRGRSRSDRSAAWHE
jgi:2-dehydro-3-deoxyphosphogluconate aldolase/(4S)-4-hydroxy-2-oxoglutarate aldolase